MSSLKVETLHREFFYNGTRIPDPVPAMSVEQVRELLTPSYPELATATTRWPRRHRHSLALFVQPGHRFQGLTMACLQMTPADLEVALKAKAAAPPDKESELLMTNLLPCIGFLRRSMPRRHRGLQDQEQRRQGRLVVAAVLAWIPRVRGCARKLRDCQHMFDPSFMSPFAVPTNHSPVVESPVIVMILQRLPDAPRQRPFYFGKLILLAGSFILGLGVFFQPLFRLLGIAVAVNPHHAIERSDQHPVKGCTQSLSLAFERLKRWSNLEISTPTAALRVSG